MQQSLPTWFVVRIFCIAMAYGPLDGRVALSGIYRCLPVHPVLSAELAGTMTPSDSCLSIWCWRTEPPFL